MPDLVSTRRSLHAVAELLLAGPQYATHGTIKLAVKPGGFGTVREPVTVVVGDRLRVGDLELSLDGRTITEIADELRIAPSALTQVYTDGCGLDENHRLHIDVSAASELHEAFRRGDEALASFAPTHERVLWPEHFDLGTSVDDVNYGVSPGDDYVAVPYAYVGPWSLDGVEGTFWNAPFGAAAPVSSLTDLAAFFAEGARLLAGRR